MSKHPTISNRRLLSVADQWFVKQESDNFKQQYFIENSVLKIATEKQPPTQYTQSNFNSQNLTIIGR